MKIITIFKLSVLFMLTMGLSHKAQAQVESYSQVRVVFSGTVFSEDTHERVIGAKVYVYQQPLGQAPLLVGGGETNSEGNFYINKYFQNEGSIYKNWLEPGKYFLKIDIPGYQSLYTDYFYVSTQSEFQHFGDIVVYLHWMGTPRNTPIKKDQLPTIILNQKAIIKK